MTTYGLLIFDGAEELDFAGPWEVFTVSAMLRDQGDTAVLIAQRPGAVRCAKGMQVLPDFFLNDHPPLDVLLVPGGMGTRREVSNPAITGWITKVSAEVTWVTSVCTGALLLHEAGPARGRRVATHHAFEDTLTARGDVTVVRDARYVVDGTWSPARACPFKHRHGLVADRPDPWARSRTCGPPVHPVRARTALPRRRAPPALKAYGTAQPGGSLLDLAGS